MFLRTYLSDVGVDHGLRRVIDFLGNQIKYIASDVKTANRAVLDTKNVFGETQLAIDKTADQRIERALAEEKSFGLLELVSEEGDEIRKLNTWHPSDLEEESRISVTVDPLDGSSLIKSNLAVGTILGFHRDVYSIRSCNDNNFSY